jgi:peptide chain release factor 2
MNDLGALRELAEESGDAGLANELTAELDQFEPKLTALRLELLLSGELDSKNAIVAIHPGAGGTESQDWAQMLLRMYVRWAENKKFKVETLDLIPGEEAGVSRPRQVCIGWCAFPPSMRTRGDIPPLPPCSSIPRWMRTSTS